MKTNMNKTKKFDPFKNLVLDKYEQEIEEALERDEYVPAKNAGEINKMLDEAVKNYPELEESRSITLRVKKKDLIRLKAKAYRNNVPYQTLISLLIRQYIKGEKEVVLD